MLDTFSDRVLDYLVIVIFVLLFVLLGQKAASVITHEYDSTDNVEQKERSGFSVYTDHLTSCQYLGRGTSGLTPRLNVKGLHEGCK
jgi:hypothetical protein